MMKNGIVLIVASTFLLSACGGNDSSGKNKDVKSHIPEYKIKNPVVSTSSFDKNDSVLASVSTERTLLSYKMLGVDGKETVATALVFVPNSVQPKEGWSTVVWAHGTTGVADQCAPSQQGLAGNEYFIAQLLQAGYVVVAPDYEGLGSAGNHPFLNVKSEALSITDAVAATREYLSKKGQTISKNWLAIGHSQGGHAALGAAEYASRIKLNYKGTIAIAPASNLQSILLGSEQKVAGQPWNIQLPVFTSLDTFNSLAIAGTQGHKNVIHYNEAFKSNLATLAPLAETECYQAVATAIGTGMYQYAVARNPNTLDGYGRLQDNFLQNTKISTFLNKDSQPLTVKVNTPVIIYHGGADTTVPSEASDLLYASATQLGIRVDYIKSSEWDHTTVYTQNFPAFLQEIKTLMPIQ